MQHSTTATKKAASEIKASKQIVVTQRIRKAPNIAVSSYAARKFASIKHKVRNVVASKPSEVRINQLMKEFTTKFGLSSSVIAEILDVSVKTLSRYQASAKELSPQQRDRIEMVAAILGLGKRILGNEDEVKRWLNEEVHSIENQKPIKLIVSESGRRRVENVLLQIEGGVF